MVPKISAIARVEGVINAVAVDADFVGELMLSGPGAGGDATASAVVADIVDIARGVRVPPFGRPAASLASRTGRRRCSATRAATTSGSLSRPAGRLRGDRAAHGGREHLARIDHAAPPRPCRMAATIRRAPASRSRSS